MLFRPRKRTIGERLGSHATDLRDRFSEVGDDVIEHVTVLSERLAEQAQELRDQVAGHSRPAPRRVTDHANRLRHQVLARTGDWRAELMGRSQSARKELLRHSTALRQMLPGQQPPPKSRSMARIAGGIVGGIIGAAVGALAVASQAGRDVVRLDRSIDAEPRVWQWRGHRVVFYQHGPEQGAPLVLLHSINAAASAYEMRAPFARLGDRYNVFALDLLGFGASDRPNIQYSPELYAELLSDFLAEVSASAHVVASSLSGAIAVLAADSRPDLFKSLLLVNPTGLVTAAGQAGAGNRLVQQVLRLPLLGAGLFNVLVSRPSLRYYLRRVYGEVAFLDQRTVEQNYLTAHQPGARHAPGAFLSGSLNVALNEPLQRLRPRTLVLWSGRNRMQNVRKEREAFGRVNPELEMQTLEEAGALAQDERREEFEQLLRDWIGRDERPKGRRSGQQEVGE